MKERTRLDLYRKFIEFVRDELQHERKLVNQRMFSVFLWCFILPALVSLCLLLLVKFGLLPAQARFYLDWLVLIFPVSYSLYFLSAEVLTEIPAAFRRGGMANTLTQALKDGEWRTRVCTEMKKSVQASPEDWKWLVTNFEMDLQGLMYRTRFLTALGGAVFFLIMQGIDSLTDTPTAFEGFDAFGGSNYSQFAGVGLFLGLLYLSGSQTYHSLKRYLNCAQLQCLELQAPAEPENKA